MDGYTQHFQHLEEVSETIRAVLADKNVAKEAFGRIYKRELASTIPLPLVLLKQRFKLSKFEYICILLAVAAELIEIGYPSFKTAVEFYSLLDITNESVYNSFFGAPLCYILSFFERGFRLNKDVFKFVLNGDKPYLKGCYADLYPKEREQILGFINHASLPVLVRLIASHGAGKRTLARHISEELGRGSFLVEINEDASNEIVLDAVSTSIMRGYVPIIFGMPHRYVNEIALATGLAFFCGVDNICDNASDLSVLEVNLNAQDKSVAYKMWDFAGGNLDLDAVCLSERYKLNAGQIINTIKALESRAIEEGDVVSHTLAAKGSDMDAVQESIRRYNKECGFARLLIPAFGLDDLVIDDKTRKKLDTILMLLRVRHKVYDIGFDKLFPYGRGVGILFFGTSGTGKTMAAQALAKELGLDVLVADISRIVDKYIGETEKHINEIFDAAKRSNCILFFDEADSIFARRTEVSDSFDRSANAQTAHLLQKMEDYDGAVILATNTQDNIDDAFKRRLPFVVEFLKPNAAQRLSLWQRFIPSQMPQEELDFDYLSNFELTPAVIKWTAFLASSRAIDLGVPLAMSLIVDALKDEYEKMGTSFPIVKECELQFD